MKLIQTFSLAALAATSVMAAPMENDAPTSAVAVDEVNFSDEEIAKAMKTVNNNAKSLADLRNGRLRKPLKEKIEEVAMSKIMEAGIPEDFGKMLEGKQAEMDKMWGMIKEMWNTHESMKNGDNKRNIVVQGNMIVNNGEEINMGVHHDDEHDDDHHDDDHHDDGSGDDDFDDVDFESSGDHDHKEHNHGDHKKEKKEMSFEKFEEAVGKFAHRAYFGYGEYQECVHTVEYLALEQLMTAQQMDDFKTSLLPAAEGDNAARKRREAAELPMSEEEVREYLMFDENQDLKSFYAKNGEWLMDEMANKSEEEVADMNKYFAMMGNFLDEEKMEGYKILMPYIDHLTYQFCVVKPQWERFAEKYMPEGYNPAAELENHKKELAAAERAAEDAKEISDATKFTTEF